MAIFYHISNIWRHEQRSHENIRVWKPSKPFSKYLSNQFNKYNISFIKYLQEYRKLPKLRSRIYHHQFNQIMALCSLLNFKIATEIFVSRTITKDVMCIINSHRHREWLHTLKKGINLLTKVTHEKRYTFGFGRPWMV